MREYIILALVVLVGFAMVTAASLLGPSRHDMGDNVVCYTRGYGLSCLRYPPTPTAHP